MASTKAVVLLLVLLAAVAQAANFGASIGATRCNIDLSRGEVNNPCGTLYNAVCGGIYCSCPEGYVEDPHLHNCVPGGGDNDPNARAPHQPSVDPFDDLPFDYQPPGQQPATGRPLQPATGRPLQPASGMGIYNDVSDTRCNRDNDPCPSLYNAVCGGTHCVCPQGTRHHSSVARCDPIPPSTGRQGGGGGGFHVIHDHDDHDDRHDHDDDDDNDGWLFGRGGASLPSAFVNLPIGFLTAAVFVWMM